jgi:hypothetical protein
MISKQRAAIQRRMSLWTTVQMEQIVGQHTTTETGLVT